MKQPKKEKLKQKLKYRQAVFVVIYKKQEGKTFYLVLKRKKHWTGWEFTKGGIEKNEKPLTAAKREVFEESGLVPMRVLEFSKKGKYKYPKLLKDRPGYIGQSYQLFAAQVQDNLGRIEPQVDRKEHSKYKWLEYSQAKKILKYKNQKKCLRIVNKFIER